MGKCIENCVSIHKIFQRKREREKERDRERERGGIDEKRENVKGEEIRDERIMDTVLIVLNFSCNVRV